MGPRNRRRERAEQLAQLFDGSLAPDDAAADLRRLASLASTVTEQVATPALDDDARERMRTRILAELHTDLQAADPTSVRVRRRGGFALATGVACVVFGAAGVAVAAQGALRAIRVQLREPVLGGDGFTSAAEVTEIEHLLRSTTLPPWSTRSAVCSTGPGVVEDTRRGVGETADGYRKTERRPIRLR